MTDFHNEHVSQPVQENISPILCADDRIGLGRDLMLAISAQQKLSRRVGKLDVTLESDSLYKAIPPRRGQKQSPIL